MRNLPFAAAAFAFMLAVIPRTACAQPGYRVDAGMDRLPLLSLTVPAIPGGLGLMGQAKAPASGEAAVPPDTSSGQAAPGAPLEPGRWYGKGSIGFTLSPDTFLMGLEVDYALNEHVRLGPLAQFGVSGGRSIIAPSLNVQYVFGLPDEPAGMKSLKPFVQGGVGFAYMHKERRGKSDDDDVGVMLNIGFGFEYSLTPEFALGSSMLFNVLPAEVTGQHFFFSWQVLTATFSW